jgi:hypothetical protein
MFKSGKDKGETRIINFSILNNISQLTKPIELKLPNFYNCKCFDELRNINKKKFITKKRGRKLKQQSLENINNKSEIYLGNKVHDKFSNDNVKRKLKGLYHKYIISLLNSIIQRKFKMKKKFVHINSKITKNISIEYNRSLLNKKIKDIIIDVSKKYADKDNNEICIKIIESHNDNEEIMKLLNMTYKDLYENYYIKSNKNNTIENSFEEHKNKIMNSYGKEYLKIFLENAENIIEFFINGKKRKARIFEEIKAIDIPNDNDISESTTEINNSVNFELFFIKKNMVSTGSQTDLENINSRLIFFA